MSRGFIDGEYQDGEIRGCSFLAGIRGMGKTTEVARRLNACGGGTVFFDPLAKHGPLFPSGVLIHQPGQLQEYLRINRGRRVRVVYQPRAGSLDAHFQAVCAIVRAFGWLVLAVDELDTVSGPRWGSSWMCQEFYHLVNYGRHCRVSLLATARYPNAVPRGYTSQCTSMSLFRITEPKHLKYFEEYIGAENTSRLPSLPKYQYLRWSGDGEPSAMCNGANTL
jgi:hypothetical protein